jgi:hypothetical protein
VLSAPLVHCGLISTMLRTSIKKHTFHLLPPLNHNLSPGLQQNCICRLDEIAQNYESSSQVWGGDLKGTVSIGNSSKAKRPTT